MDMPIMYKKNGATWSVKLSPFQTVCLSVKNTCASDPGKFTMIIAATVNPRRASRDVILCRGIAILNKSK